MSLIHNHKNKKAIGQYIYVIQTCRYQMQDISHNTGE